MRKVVCAANKMPDGFLVLGARHYDLTMHSTYERIDPDRKYNYMETIQGFIDQFGAFMDRREAFQVAKESGQIKEDKYGSGELYSEDLY